MNIRPTFTTADDLTEEQLERMAKQQVARQKLAVAKQQAYADGERHGLQQAELAYRAAHAAQAEEHERDLNRMQRMHEHHMRAVKQGSRAVGGVAGVIVGAITTAVALYAMQQATLGAAFDAASNATERGVAAGAVLRAAEER
jgi:hypothetical protein